MTDELYKSVLEYHFNCLNIDFGNYPCLNDIFIFSTNDNASSQMGCPVPVSVLSVTQCEL